MCALARLDTREWHSWWLLRRVCQGRPRILFQAKQNKKNLAKILALKNPSPRGSMELLPLMVVATTARSNQIPPRSNWFKASYHQASPIMNVIDLYRCWKILWEKKHYYTRPLLVVQVSSLLHSENVSNSYNSFFPHRLVSKSGSDFHQLKAHTHTIITWAGDQVINSGTFVFVLYSLYNFFKSTNTFFL